MLALRIAFLEISWFDVIDIALVALLFHQAYKLIRGSIAVNILMGGLALYLAYLVVRATKMELLSTILGQFMSIGVLATLILFQQEIRRFLLLIGKSAGFNRETLLKSFSGGGNAHRHELYMDEILEAVKILQTTQTGALIVISKNSDLKFFIETGDAIDSVVSRRMLLSIFNKNGPLHDGAVIIHNGRIKGASCVLPVSESETLPPEYGLRHRSAVGASEVTDALVIVVSEETGRLVVARDGQHFDGMKIEQVERRILEYLEDKEFFKTRSHEAKASRRTTPAPR